MDTFVDFLKSPWGNLCIGIASSILGAFLYMLFDELVRKTSKHIKRKRFVKYLVEVGESFNDGYTTAYARIKSPFHQMLHIGNHEIGIMVAIAKVLFAAVTGIAFLVLFQEYVLARPLIIALTCLLVAFFYKSLKRKLKAYQIMFDYVFGDEYKKHMLEGVEKHWDSLVRKDSNNDKGNEA